MPTLTAMAPTNRCEHVPVSRAYTIRFGPGSPCRVAPAGTGMCMPATTPTLHVPSKSILDLSKHVLDSLVAEHDNVDPFIDGAMQHHAADLECVWYVI
jgi:hypothetical protein